ncbi:hypothetical protein YC2023_004616 [Brassica napus]
MRAYTRREDKVDMQKGSQSAGGFHQNQPLTLQNASTPRFEVRTPNYAISCRLQEIQVSSPRKSNLLMQTTEEKFARNLQHSASRSGQRWIFIEQLR